MTKMSPFGKQLLMLNLYKFCRFLYYRGSTPLRELDMKYARNPVLLPKKSFKLLWDLNRSLLGLALRDEHNTSLISHTLKKLFFCHQLFFPISTCGFFPLAKFSSHKKGTSQLYSNIAMRGWSNLSKKYWLSIDVPHFCHLFYYIYKIGPIRGWKQR